MTLHLVAPVPAFETTKAYEACAFTARSRVLATMMSRFGRVILYSGEHNEAKVTEHVPIIDRAWQKHHFPEIKPGDVFSDFDPGKPFWQEFNTLAAVAIRKRAKPGDILGLTMGTAHQPLATMLADQSMLNVEIGIGYSGVWAPFRVFESHAWQTYLASRNASDDVRFFDAVIPRAYEVEDFPAGDGSGGYFLFMGRVIARKGPQIAAETCRRLGAKLIVAGPGVASAEPGKITGSDGTVLEGDVEYAGIVGPEDRARLMGDAIATMTPTQYLEPFGGTHAESLLTGTPVVSTSHGCFPEYIQDGVNGYKCGELAEFMRACRDAPSLDRALIRENAIQRYGTDTVGRQMDAYLRKLVRLRREGWYEIPPEPFAHAA